MSVESAPNELVFRWLITPGATHYRLLENADGHSGFTQIGADIPADVLATTLAVPVHLHDFVNSLYIVQACNQIGCTGSREVSPMQSMLRTIGYFKASNTESGDQFGRSIALSDDGTTLAVGAIDSSSSIGINGSQSDNTAARSGSVYVFRSDGRTWVQEAYIKASNTESGDEFGIVALSGDGNTLAVAASAEDGGGIGINGDQDNNAAAGSGAVYLFRFNGTDWFQEAYIKAANSDAEDAFGSSVALSTDGDTLVVGAHLEDGSGTGVNGALDDNSASDAGAAYVFRFDGQDWFEEAYIKASNTGTGDQFGFDVALSDSGDTLAVGAPGEQGSATGINGIQNDESPDGVGAVYVFRFEGTDWIQETYVKPSSIRPNSLGDGLRFGHTIDLSGDGDTLVVGANRDSSDAIGIDGDQNSGSIDNSGAVFLYRFRDLDWMQEAYFKASNTGFDDGFGSAVALGAGGNILAVAAPGEDSNATGIGGTDSDNSAGNSGAVYLFRFASTGWHQHAFVKASNTESGDGFGSAIALSSDGGRMAVGAPGEGSNATGIIGDQSDNSAPAAGALYLY
ncbi:MAG: FG-GAP repeat protein [Woeseiaceae bacterium]